MQVEVYSKQGVQGNGDSLVAIVQMERGKALLWVIATYLPELYDEIEKRAECPDEDTLDKAEMRALQSIIEEELK